jgi:excisionase family DNA binding protein
MPHNIEVRDATSKPGEGLLSVKEAAAYLGISEGWLYQSGIPFAKLGRRRLYRRADLDQFVADHLSHGLNKAGL